jgi:hypothetical protein
VEDTGGSGVEISDGMKTPTPYNVGVRRYLNLKKQFKFKKM